MVGFTGAAAFAPLYRDWLHVDLSLSTAISIAFVLVLFGLFFRSLRILPWVALPLGLGLVCTASLGQLLLGKISAVSLAFGSVLLAIGIDVPIQFYNRLREELATRPAPEALRHTFAQLYFPSLIATMAPAAVFFCCALSDYRGIQELGLLAGLGLGLNWLAMVTVFPALVSILPEAWWARAAAPPAEGLLFRLGRFSARFPRPILLAALAVAIVALPFARSLRVEPQLNALQPKDMLPARVQAELEQRFGQQSNGALIYVEADSLEPALELSDRYATELERLRRQRLLQGYQTLSTMVPSHKSQAARAAVLQDLHPDALKGTLEAALAKAGFALDSFAPFLHQFDKMPTLSVEALPSEVRFVLRSLLHQEKNGRVALALFAYPAAEQRRDAIAALTAFAAQHGGVISGAPVLEGELGSILSSDARKLGVASFVVVTLLLAIYYRAPRPVLTVMLPLGLAWLLFAAVMARFIPLNLFNLLALPLAIGYGIDDQIFLMHRYREAGDTGVMLASSGRAIVLTSISTMAGFAGLGVAHFAGLRQLGFAGALAVGCCLVAAFAVLPALVSLLWAKSN